MREAGRFGYSGAVISPQSLLRPAPAGLYCPPGDFYIDPVRPVARAVITHGHADHARAGHGAVLATLETLAIMEARYGAGFAQASAPLDYGAPIARDGVEVSLVPAGHVLGSAQVVVRWKGLTMVVSGDYKRRRDPTCAAFEPVPCDVFITEATFALPVFRHPPDGEEIAKLLASVGQFPERSHVLGAYALGKAQRLLCLLREAGWDRPIYVHGALEGLNGLYRRFGVDLGPLAAATVAANGGLAGEIIIAPPSALTTPWMRRFADPVSCFASGWMRIRARARQRGIELPLVISDHADWDELTATIAELRPAQVWITHGREEALARWCALEGISAQSLDLVGYDEESGRPGPEQRRGTAVPRQKLLGDIHRVPSPPSNPIEAQFSGRTMIRGRSEALVLRRRRLRVASAGPSEVHVPRAREDDFAYFEIENLGEAVRYYRDEGYVVLRNLIAPEYCDRVRAQFESVGRYARTPILRQKNMRYERNRLTPEGFLDNPIFNVQDLNTKAFGPFKAPALDILTHARVAQVTEAILGGPPKVVQSMFFEAAAGTWAHQDSYYQGQLRRTGRDDCGLVRARGH